MNFLNRFGIRGKILFSVFVFVLVFFVIEAIVFYQVFLSGFKSIEKKDMVSEMQRVEALINDQINNYSIKLSDWSNWDDTYNFMVDANTEYSQSNLQDLSLVSLKVNFIVFISSNGAIFKEKGTNLQTGKDLPVPDDLHDLLSKSNKITLHITPDSQSQGIVKLSNGFILFASRPILTSDANGPIRGTIFFARYIDQEFLAKISKLEASKVDIRDYNSSSLPSDFTEAKAEMFTKGEKFAEPNGDLDTYYVKEESQSLLSGYTVIDDINGNKAFIIKNELSRPFYLLGNNTILFSLIIFGIVGIFSMFFAFFLLNFFVISKITKLNKDVEEVVNPENSRNRLEVKGNDEFSNLAKNMNKMLDEIFKSNEDLEKFKMAIENTSDHIIMTDPDGKIIYGNKSAEKLTGYSVEEMIGKTPRLWGGQMSKEFYVNLWDTIKNKKISFTGELTNKKKSGELYPVEAKISPILDKEGNVLFFIGVERNISSEKKLEENLLRQNEEIAKKVELQTKEIKEEQDRLFKILESMPTAVFVLNGEGKFYYMNSQARELLGTGSMNIKQNDLLKLDVGMDHMSQIYNLYKAGTNNLYPNEDLPVVQAVHGRSVTVRDIEIRNNEKNISIEVSSAPIFNSEGKIIFAIAAFKDISEEKAIERSKDEFFSIASHELRTPLTAIRGNTALIKQYYQDKIADKDMNEMIDDIHSSSIRLIQIVNDFLNVSRLEQGKMEFKLENFDLIELISKKIIEVENMAKEKNLSINFEIGTSQLPKVYADKNRLGEVVLNLLGNAIKYTEKGEIIVSIDISGKFEKVSIKDTGRGIAPEYISLLFKKFEQAGENILTRDTTKGTGLGLYISKLMIQQMGGEIYLESSEENKGSVFSFVVPVAK